ncbi:hypothetical protein [Shewanella sp.]|uniref:hypothetical protein n=1 Tax=Shewanella sp. TaxID=50422 RepID=UPI001ED455E0|nr:hypothetical protein [Shewanella sp.]NRB22729.1 hypothetical protein [Shewanella sp.]
MKKKTKKFKRIVIISSIFLISPIVLSYVYQFGHGGLSNKTQDWANFSTYVGGLLTPIITFFTIVFLYFQIRSSREESELQIAENSRSVERQLCHLQDTRTIEMITAEINYLVSVLFNMISEPQKVPDENIKICLDKINFKRWDHDHANKQVIFHRHDGESSTIEWADVVIYLKSLYENYSEEEVAIILKNYKYAHVYSTISSLLGHLVLHCYRLAHIDKNSYDIIKTHLSLFSPTVFYLKKAGYISEDIEEEICILQSLSRPITRTDYVDFNGMFSSEINELGWFDAEVKPCDITNIRIKLDGGPNNRHVIYTMDYMRNKLTRRNSNWIK